MATTNTKAAAAAERATYVVISPLEHGEPGVKGGKPQRYEIGDELELTEADAAPLLGHTVKPAKAD